MRAIEVLIDEHRYILRMLKVIRKLCIHTLNTGEVYYEGFRHAIDFVRNFADKFHHGKEEDILFEVMSKELGQAIKQGPIYGMLAEHDLGRLFIKTLEEALLEAEKGNNDAKVDIIANAICYTDLLHRHIDKEDNAIFTFARDQLKEAVLAQLDEDFEKAKIRLESDATRQKYIALLESLEAYAGKLIP